MDFTEGYCLAIMKATIEIINSSGCLDFVKAPREEKRFEDNVIVS